MLILTHQFSKNQLCIFQAQCDEHFALCCRPLNDTNVSLQEEAHYPDKLSKMLQEAIRDQPIKEPAGKWGTTGE